MQNDVIYTIDFDDLKIRTNRFFSYLTSTVRVENLITNIRRGELTTVRADCRGSNNKYTLLIIVRRDTHTHTLHTQ